MLPSLIFFFKLTIRWKYPFCEKDVFETGFASIYKKKINNVKKINDIKSPCFNW